MARLFFSYSHKDETYRDELEVHLALLKRQELIEAWHDRRIVAGDEFAGAISEQLEQAHIILLLVSPYFIASDYCFDIEMKRAMERHNRREARVIPVILEPCEWHHAPFGKLNAVPKDGKPVSKYPNKHDAFLEVAQAVRQALGALPTGSKAGVQSSPSPATGPTVVRDSEIRSSNLRIKKTFSDHDRDRFLDESFEYLANFIEGSLRELAVRNPDISTSFKRPDAEHLNAVVYRHGSAISQCRIWVGSSGFARSRGIYYSSAVGGGDNSFNESMSIGDDSHSLVLVPLGMAHVAGSNGNLSQQGAAEYFWAILMRPLQ